MPDYLNIMVYLRAGDARMLRAAGHDPAAYVRALVREELDRRADMLAAEALQRRGLPMPVPQDGREA
ncbi:MAG: hypothetical protein KatS3mg015_2510 [Fimbriimonadales bacterium]|nr:MAG: hypothetical protein KatS3mg015_2510 [Fimbriimonadales bacterium]